MIRPATSPTWRTSSHSNGNVGSCVEVAGLTHHIAVRDTKDRAAGHITVPPASWRVLLTHTAH